MMKAIVKIVNNQHFIIMIIVNVQNNVKIVIYMIIIVQVVKEIKFYIIILIINIIVNVRRDIKNHKLNYIYAYNIKIHILNLDKVMF